MKRSQAALTVVLLLAATSTGCVDRAPIAEPAAFSFAHAEHPPFTLEITAVDLGGEVEITAIVVLHEPLPVPLELAVAVPHGKTLVNGRAYERVTRPVRGRSVVRTFRARGVAHAPLTITVSQHVGEVMGAHATQTWPPPAPDVFDASWVPIPPAAHGAVVVSEAIALVSSAAP